jgi:hypothetical protein
MAAFEQVKSLILRSGVFAASRRMRSVASWFETAQERLLTMSGSIHLLS